MEKEHRQSCLWGKPREFIGHCCSKTATRTHVWNIAFVDDRCIIVASRAQKGIMGNVIDRPISCRGLGIPAAPFSSMNRRFRTDSPSTGTVAARQKKRTQ